MSEARDYVLVIEHGTHARGDVYITREIVRAYTAADAKARWNADGFPIDRLVDVEPYEEHLVTHQEARRR